MGDQVNLKNFLKTRFGKDLFSLNQDDILKERIKIEKQVECISDDVKGVQVKIQKLMLEAKGQPKTLKLLNIQKIKALRLESATKQQEASQYLQQLQLLLLVEAMREQERFKQASKLTQRILSTDIEQLNQVLLNLDVRKAIEEGRIDSVKEKLTRVFGKEELPVDLETQDLLHAIEDLEKVDEETALKMAGEKAKTIAEEPIKKKVVEEE